MEGSGVQQVPFWCYLSSCDTPAVFQADLLVSLSWCRLCPLPPPTPATTAASPRGAAQMLVRGVQILSYTSVIQSRALATQAEPRAPLPRSAFSLPLLAASISCFHLHPSGAKCMQWCLQAVLLRSVQCTTLFLPASFYFLVSKIKL